MTSNNFPLTLLTPHSVTKHRTKTYKSTAPNLPPPPGSYSPQNGYKRAHDIHQMYCVPNYGGLLFEPLPYGLSLCSRRYFVHMCLFGVKRCGRNAFVVQFYDLTVYFVEMGMLIRS